MAKNPIISEPTDQGIGPPPARHSDILLTEVAKLQNDGEYTKRDLGEMRTDMRDVRDRLSRLEERVAHLPGKGFIVLVVTTSLFIVGGLLTIAPKLQSMIGVSLPIADSSISSQSIPPPQQRPAQTK